MKLRVHYALLIVAFSFVIGIVKGEGMPTDGLIITQSKFGPRDVIARLEEEIKAKGLTIFAAIDHAAGAAAVSLPLRFTYVLIFGSAKSGTPLMQDMQTIGIDLPLKILVWEDAEGRTWLGYNDPRWLSARHRLGSGSESTVAAMAALLNALVTKAAAGQ